MIVRMRVRFGTDESVQCAAIVEMELAERGRHPLGTDDPRAGGREGDGG